MIITRKIEVFINEPDPELRKGYYKKIQSWRHLVRNGANELMSYLYSVDKLKYYKFLTDETKVELGIIGAKGEQVKESSAGYVLLSEKMKGQIPMNISTCLQQAVLKKYRDTRNEILRGNVSLCTYKNNIPIPFSSNSIRQLRWDQDKKSFLFNLFGIPFGFITGRDRSNNRGFLESCVNGEVKLCGSSIIVDDKRRKLFISIAVDVSQKEVILEDDKCLNAFLSIDIPIVATFGESVKHIGNKEEYLHRRLQIQAAIKRAQQNCRYAEGGKGRKRKLQSLERFHNKEKEYIKTRIHTYSKILVDYALENRCKTINLINQTAKENEARKRPFLLRNWGYYSIKQKIEYKARLYGIEVKLIS
ncbi:MAG: hypothetical protein AB9922_11685 [Bacteroidales bacterium]